MKRVCAARNARRERWWASEAQSFYTLCYFKNFSFLWQCCQFSQKKGPNDFKLPFPEDPGMNSMLLLIRARAGEWGVKQHWQGLQGCKAGVRHQNTRSHPCLRQRPGRIWDCSIFTVKSRGQALVRWGGQSPALSAVEDGAVGGSWEGGSAKPGLLQPLPLGSPCGTDGFSAACGQL